MRYFLYCRKSTEEDDRQVMSIESQQRELDKAFGARGDIEIVEKFEEAKSAKSPGRPIFAAMISRLENGEAEGIVAWAPDRLARNSVDGGQIVYLLDRGVIRDLKFSTYTFENNSQGKFMLNIMFGQSKYYSDSLSENVRRGNRTKLEHGWRPNKAPLGYRNDPDKTISVDPICFPLVRRMFELALTGVYSPRQIAVIARDDWGLRTPKRRRTGGTALTLSAIYKMLGNPFYAGVIHWDGRVYSGKHTPVVTLEQFDRVQELLNRNGRPRPKKYVFPFTGLIRCADCGLMITAEQKVNKYGSRYVYYHCTKRGLGPRCPQPSVSAQALERQIVSFLASIAIHPVIEEWVLIALRGGQAGAEAIRLAREESRKAALTETATQLTELTSLRLRRLLTDEEFLRERRRIELEELRLNDQGNTTEGADAIELFMDVVSFSNCAVKWFQAGDAQLKRLILKITGSNFSLRGKMISIQAAKPFLAPPFSADFLRLCGDGEDVRTFPAKLKPKLRRYMRDFAAAIDDPAWAKARENLPIVLERMQNEEWEEAT